MFGLTFTRTLTSHPPCELAVVQVGEVLPPLFKASRQYVGSRVLYMVSTRVEAVQVELHTWSLAESTLYASPDVTEPPRAATTTGRTAHARRKQARRPSPACGVTPRSSMLGRSQWRGGRDDVLGCPRLRAMTDCRLCSCPVQPMRKTRPVWRASQNKSANRPRRAEAGRGGPRLESALSFI